MIGGEGVFVICEAGVTNFGDPELARAQVDAAANAGADAVKFQAWRTESLVSRPVARRLSGELGYDWYERLSERELSFEHLRTLQGYARERGVRFFATPHDDDSLDFLDRDLAVPFLKVGSGEASNFAFLRRVGARGRPVIISFGLQSDDEARRAVDVLREAGAPEVLALHCVSLYPTPAAMARLERIPRLAEALGMPVGISDHSVGWHVVLAAVALGACAVEKHLTFDKADPRSLDNPGALEPDEFAAMVAQIRDVEAALRPVPDEAYETATAGSADWAMQAVVAARDLEAGTRLAAEDLAAKRPARGGIPAAELDSVVGRTLARAVPADEQIAYDDLSA